MQFVSFYIFGIKLVAYILIYLKKKLMIKWICAALGYALSMRLSGAFVGYLLGYLIEELANGKSRKADTIFSDRQSRTTNSQSRKSKPNITPKDFELNLLSLASLVIKADGKVNPIELNYVRQYFVATYGKDRANETFKVFNDVVKKREINTFRISNYIAQRARYESRLQIIHFLFGIANADGKVSTNEALKIKEIAGFFRIHYKDFESIYATFYKKPDSAYKILGIEKTATNTEIKKAYRSMAKKYHPDKLQHLPDHLLKGAEEKFQAVQQAYEQLQKERNF